MSSTPTNIIVDAKAITQRLRGPDGTLTILESLDFQLQPREAAAILGASGSGKSTLLGLLAGLDVPSDGDIYLLGQNLTTLDEDGRATLRAGQVGFVFQSFQLLPTLSALENVRLPLELAEQPLERAEALLDAVGLGHRLHHLPGQLSGGEQQRVALARAFAIQPHVLFADEPTGNLDQATGEKVIDLLFDLREQHGTALVLVTHDPALAARCDRQYQLQAGRLC
jgi:putative ABC transport system ATP-binding protein